MSEPRVLVMVRDNCHLCEVALEVIAEVCTPRGITWQTKDIDADVELRRRFTDQVPVTFVDGEQHDIWRVDPERLAAALDRPTGR
ncbi:glutaredoxin family protein [Enemella sp. A6]|uniref:glutaredoxin family protein n=1 Tax=Enemella sp. A6 TaxID=3440152 RepID=UPI003EB8E12C